MGKTQSPETLKLKKLLRKEVSTPERNEYLGLTTWKLDGVFHRDFGPAVIWDSGQIEYYKHGKRHREEGPAAIMQDGTKFYWIDGYSYTEEEFKAAQERAKLTDEEFEALFFKDIILKR